MAFITLQDVSLDYLIKTGSDSFKKSLIHCVKRGLGYKPARSIKNSSYKALHSLNLSLQSGDKIGLVGCNGAGKSTLLRVLARIYKPTTGHIYTEGKIATLFDINLGMNPEATGHENIINLSIMRGITRKKALALTQEIADFTELGTFLQQPVRTYSAGMQVKLAFAVATSIAADIMLLDEIIGAGDIHFMEKATERLENHLALSKIVVLASHSNNLIRRFCNKVLVLKKGEVHFFGEVEEGLAFYENSSVSLRNADGIL